MLLQHSADRVSSISINDVQVEFREGYMPFLNFLTYYQIVGNSDSNNAPLILIHGGPGGGHDTLESLYDLSVVGNRQLILYDQLGCGKSYVGGHKELWCLDTWVNELDSLIAFLGIKKCHLLGQSWGGMLIIAYLCDRNPITVCSAIISSSLCSSKLWGEENLKNIKKLPQDIQNVITNAISNNDFSSKEYIDANAKFCEFFANDAYYPNGPECFNRGKAKGADEVYLTAWGPNEYTPSGTLKNFEYTEKLHNIKQSCLVINGTNDLCTNTMAKTISDGIPNSQWVQFEGCRHRCYFEGGQKYKNLVQEFIGKNE